MPSKQPLGCQWLTGPARRVEHHLNDALNSAPNTALKTPIRRSDRGWLNTKPSGNRRSHSLGREDLALDCTGLNDLVGQG